MRKKDHGGFTLIELLVVISIIGLLSSVVLASLTSARGRGRDVKRIAELKQLQLAMELFFDDNGRYPREADGANGRVGEGAGLDTMLAPYLSGIPRDPLGPGTSYYYYYDGRHNCRDSGGNLTRIAVIFARNMEEQAGNGSDFCATWGGEGGAGQPEAWHIVIGPSSG